MKSTQQSGKLTGQTILVPRPAPLPGNRDKLADLLKSAGAEVIQQPVIELVPVSLESVRADFDQLAEYRTIVFVSSPGVHYFCELLAEMEHLASEILSQLHVAAIGPGTSDELESRGVQVDFVPGHADSKSLADGLIAQNAPEPLLLIRADRGSQVLSDALTAAGKSHDQLVVYESRDIAELDQATSTRMDAGGIDWVALTSPSIATGCIRLFGDSLTHTKLATISHSITNVVTPFGLTVSAEASSAGFRELVDAIEKAS